ncbi:hypothetical protein CAP35_12920 [Chitinophagaceae bacterium IBVUCB1]|nr:hypothetical protein CAP35_12920 [Chitinophagaceae bacterium IBVUCB1]
MAKKKPTPETSTTESIAIQPVSVEQVIVTSEQEMEVPQGYVLLVALKEDGTDKAGSEFFYPEKNYLKYYGDTTKFRLKGKHEITENTHYEYLSRTSQQIISRTGGGCNSCGR